MASLKKQMLPSARRVATCRDCRRDVADECLMPKYITQSAVATGRDPTIGGRSAWASAQTQLLAGLELRFGGEAVELAQLTHGDTVARCDAAQRVATAHSIVLGT